ncbi:MAG: hypothetical protein BJ554DRAFT_3189 [Olpidium bornovanus]|uniref:Uncharacterized protein n=1 Tax=Olpidium bornovanus TaxID=278681 RepID=A0A8H7ZPM1_9FUNG|nr:MAG: hypothetical protein BJ554DRAFT_3189 [Olpidium bornovanus]
MRPAFSARGKPFAVSEALLYPEFSIVVLYGRLVIGCAFMTPDAYITYFAVDVGWEGVGIGKELRFVTNFAFRLPFSAKVHAVPPDPNICWTGCYVTRVGEQPGDASTTNTFPKAAGPARTRFLSGCADDHPT